MRFSNSTGLPEIPDNVRDANPRGMAIRFNLAEHVHTDIVSHSTDGFPTRDAYEFLELLRAIAASGPDVPSPKPVEKFLGAHPSALAFVQAPKPFPTSFATETYFGVTAFEFSNQAGREEIWPISDCSRSGQQLFPAEEVAGIAPNYHFDEITQRVGKGRWDSGSWRRWPPMAIRSTTQPFTGRSRASRWSWERLELTAVLPDSRAQQKHIIFDPIPRVDGIEASADPLLELRAAIYLLSGRRRRAAHQEAGAEPAVSAVG